MGKLPMYTDSDETVDTCSSAENLKKKKKFSILKYTGGSVKKKCKVHSVSEPDEDFRSRVSSCQRVQNRKLRGILKHDRDRESSDEEEDLDDGPAPKARDKYLVGQVPRPEGGRPGRGGGLAILIRKSTAMAPHQSLQAQSSTSSAKKRRMMKRLARKKSY